MKKKYFKNMDVNEQLDIIINNNTLMNNFEELFYSNLMEQQREETELMLGLYTPGVDIRDHYSSFFLALSDWEKFFNNVNKDYLSEDGIILYNEISKLYEEYQNTELFDNRYNELYEIIENKCKELLSICEKQLHSYEHYSEEDVKEELRYHIEIGDYEEMYILDNDKTVVYEDITKIYK